MIRYPGGKKKIQKKIIRSIKRYYKRNKCYNTTRYVEPFFGAGAIGLQFVSNSPIRKIFINDKDIGIASLWNCIIHFPDRLCEKIDIFVPSIEKYYEYKKFLLANNCEASFFRDFDKSSIRSILLEIGFAKLAIHQISYSGLGTKSGGPLGGDKQASKYKIDCRWSPNHLKKKIYKCHSLLSKVDITGNMCFCDTFEMPFMQEKENNFFYLDPPYYVKGQELYQCYFKKEEHHLLCSYLKRLCLPWLLSYDNAKEIRQMYSWAKIREIPITYTVNGAVNKVELLITSEEYGYLLDEEKEEVVEF